MKAKKNTKPREIRLTTELIEALTTLAEQHARSWNGEVVWALMQYVIGQKRDNNDTKIPE
jgi:hypothetical protein